jgi:hypothetical protein
VANSVGICVGRTISREAPRNSLHSAVRHSHTIYGRRCSRTMELHRVVSITELVAATASYYS